MDEAISILIADDHAVVRLGLRALISGEPGMKVIGEADDGVSAVAHALALQPDVLLLDLLMPGKPGVQVIEELAEAAPRVRILVLTTFVDDEHIFPALRAGADGYLLKECGADELLRAIRDVAKGRSALHAVVASRVLHGLAQPPAVPVVAELTEREGEVLALVAQGRSNKSIAAEMSLSERTVRSHVSRILAKLHLRSRTQAALYALRNGLAQLDRGGG